MRFSRSAHLLKSFSLETLKSITRTGYPTLTELIDLVNSVIIFLSQLTLLRSSRISDCDSHSPAVLDYFLSSNSSICSIMDFPSLENSDHVVVSVPIDFPTNSKRNSPFYCIACDYSRADWDDLRDHFRDVPWENIFKLSDSAVASDFCEWFQVGINVYILHQNDQAKSH